MKRLLILFALLSLIAVPVSAVTYTYVYPFGVPSQILDVNSGVYTFLPYYSSDANAYSAYCTGAYSTGDSYFAQTYTNGYYFEFNQTAIGTQTHYDGWPVAPASAAFNTTSTDTMHILNEIVTCKKPVDDGTRYAYYLRVIIRSDRYVETPTNETYNTYFQCVDGNDNSRISGCNLALKDNFAGTWSNSTADDDGTHFITTHENATVSGYATATGYLSTERTGLPTFSEGLYELIMWPDDAYCATPGSCGTVYDPGEGNINLLVLVNDHDTGASISGAEVKLIEDAGATSFGTTNGAGVFSMIVTNQTQFRIVASKYGYTSTSKLHTTSAFGPDTVRLELSKSYVTASPTVTITDASGNVVETLDMRPSNEKDAAMMEKLRDAGPELIDLCIMGIYVFIIMGILAALGLKL